MSKISWAKISFALPTTPKHSCDTPKCPVHLPRKVCQATTLSSRHCEHTGSLCNISETPGSTQHRRPQVHSRERGERRLSPLTAPLERSCHRVRRDRTLPARETLGQHACGPARLDASHLGQADFEPNRRSAYERIPSRPPVQESHHKRHAASPSTHAADAVDLGASACRESICRAMSEAVQCSSKQPGEHRLASSLGRARRRTRCTCTRCWHPWGYPR